MDEIKKDEEVQEEAVPESVEAPSVAEQPWVPPERVKVEPIKKELPKKLVEEPKKIGAPFPGKLERLKAFITECKRVLRVTKKPDKQEFVTIVKISSIGMGIIGIIGFLVHFVKELLF
ncbi:protein translocase SEC61 complex subunit gamma [Candidatus Woesearchaeota archaeon]|nr:protein translocase SEC61 complex subunit gamma [Candidatus Woesearchaeota archaeon]